MKYFIIILALVITLLLNGCAKDATAEDSTVATPVETSTETRTNAASGEVIWIAIVTIWNPINRTIDKEFTSEVNCWNYYESGVGESKEESGAGTCGGPEFEVVDSSSSEEEDEDVSDLEEFQDCSEQLYPPID